MAGESSYPSASLQAKRGRYYSRSLAAKQGLTPEGIPLPPATDEEEAARLAAELEAEELEPRRRLVEEEMERERPHRYVSKADIPPPQLIDYYKEPTDLEALPRPSAGQIIAEEYFSMGAPSKSSIGVSPVVANLNRYGQSLEEVRVGNINKIRKAKYEAETSPEYQSAMYEYQKNLWLREEAYNEKLQREAAEKEARFDANVSAMNVLWSTGITPEEVEAKTGYNTTQLAEQGLATTMLANLPNAPDLQALMNPQSPNAQLYYKVKEPEVLVEKPPVVAYDESIYKQIVAERPLYALQYTKEELGTATRTTTGWDVRQAGQMQAQRCMDAAVASSPYLQLRTESTRANIERNLAVGFTTAGERTGGGVLGDIAKYGYSTDESRIKYLQAEAKDVYYGGLLGGLPLTHRWYEPTSQAVSYGVGRYTPTKTSTTPLSTTPSTLPVPTISTFTTAAGGTNLVRDLLGYTQEDFQAQVEDQAQVVEDKYAVLQSYEDRGLITYPEGTVLASPESKWGQGIFIGTEEQFAQYQKDYSSFETEYNKYEDMQDYGKELNKKSIVGKTEGLLDWLGDVRITGPGYIPSEATPPPTLKEAAVNVDNILMGIHDFTEARWGQSRPAELKTVSDQWLASPNWGAQHLQPQTKAWMREPIFTEDTKFGVSGVLPTTALMVAGIPSFGAHLITNPKETIFNIPSSVYSSFRKDPVGTVAGIYFTGEVLGGAKSIIKAKSPYWLELGMEMEETSTGMTFRGVGVRVVRGGIKDYYNVLSRTGVPETPEVIPDVGITFKPKSGYITDWADVEAFNVAGELPHGYENIPRTSFFRSPSYAPELLGEFNAESSGGLATNIFTKSLSEAGYTTDAMRISEGLTGGKLSVRSPYEKPEMTSIFSELAERKLEISPAEANAVGKALIDYTIEQDAEVFGSGPQKGYGKAVGEPGVIREVGDIDWHPPVEKITQEDFVLGAADVVNTAAKKTLLKAEDTSLYVIKTGEKFGEAPRPVEGEPPAGGLLFSPASKKGYIAWGISSEPIRTSTEGMRVVSLTEQVNRNFARSTYHVFPEDISYATEWGEISGRVMPENIGQTKGIGGTYAGRMTLAKSYDLAYKVIAGKRLRASTERWLDLYGEEVATNIRAKYLEELAAGSDKQLLFKPEPALKGGAIDWELGTLFPMGFRQTSTGGIVNNIEDIAEGKPSQYKTTPSKYTYTSETIMTSDYPLPLKSPSYSYKSPSYSFVSQYPSPSPSPSKSAFSSVVSYISSYPSRSPSSVVSSISSSLYSSPPSPSRYSPSSSIYRSSPSKYSSGSSPYRYSPGSSPYRYSPSSSIYRSSPSSSKPPRFPPSTPPIVIPSLDDFTKGKKRNLSMISASQLLHPIRLAESTVFGIGPKYKTKPKKRKYPVEVRLNNEIFRASKKRANAIKRKFKKGGFWV